MVVKVTVSRAAAPEREPVEGCGLLLSRLARAANRELAAGLDSLGLRSQHFGVLHLLSESGPLSGSQLAEALRIHASNLVRVLDELEGAGLIRREPDPEDRRRHRVVLTRRGGAILARAERIAAQTEADLLAPLSAADQRRLRELLGRVAAHACSRGGPGACASSGH